MLLLLIVVLLNLTAIIVRNRLRQKYQTSAFCIGDVRSSMAMVMPDVASTARCQTDAHVRRDVRRAAGGDRRDGDRHSRRQPLVRRRSRRCTTSRWTFRRSRSTAFIGPSGCGKSTLLRCLNRMNDLIDDVRITGEFLVERPGHLRAGRPTSSKCAGASAWCSRSRTRCRSRSTRTSSTACASPASATRRRSTTACERSLRGAALWDEVKDRLDTSGLSLSGGQQQRLCIARAIAIEPEIILMDEPCSALDPIATLKIEELIHELKSQYTIVIVTHNLQQAARVSDKTAFFWLGKLVEYSNTADLFTNPKEKHTEDYITGRFG